MLVHDVEFVDEWIQRLLPSLQLAFGIFIENLSVRDLVFNFFKIADGVQIRLILILFVEELSYLLGMDELTPITVRTSGLL
jgi:hypothetical protein